jgi:heat-inducible transcriptional repressor
VLANDTNYAAMVSAPACQGNKVKFIQLSRVDAHQLVAVVVVEGNIIKNNMISVDEELDDETLLKLNILLNTSLGGLSISEINLAMISRLKQQAGVHESIVSDVIDAVAEAIREDEDDLEIYTSGAKNIFKYPELADNQKASEIINTFEEKQMLSTFVRDTLTDSENKGIRVYIGEETPVSGIKDCSVVTATYELGEGMRGTIGIIGPKRMDYEKVVDSLKGLMSQLDNIYEHKEE